MPALTTPNCDFGWTAVDFHLPGTDGRSYRLADVRGPNGVVVMFLCNHCPYVKAVIDRVVRDVGELMRDHGVGAVAIMPNDTAAYPDDSFDNMKLFAERHRFPFPYLIDETQEVARAYDAVCTPDFYGFNAALELQYRGRLDASGVRVVEDPRPELKEAMIAIAKTGIGPTDQAPSMGCSIKWRAAA